MITMKRIYLFSLLLILSSSHCLNAQEARHYLTKNIEAYVGTWEYKSDDELFRIVFVKGDYHFGINYVVDCVIGGYFYQKNGVVVSDFLNDIPAVRNNETHRKVKIVGSNLNLKLELINPNRIWIHFRDVVKDKLTENGSFSLLSPTTARWKIEEESEDDFVGKKRSSQENAFSVPTDVVMTKVQ